MDDPIAHRYEADMSELSFILSPTMDQVRQAFSWGAVSVPDPEFEELYIAQPGLIIGAAESGLIVDAGHLPDKVVRELGLRGAKLLVEGALRHPWGWRPWLLTHTWTGDEHTDWMEDRSKPFDFRKDRPSRHSYLVVPDIGESGFNGMVVTEYVLANLPHHPAPLMWPQPIVRLLETSTSDKYQSEIYGPKELMVHGAASSALNPVITTLLLMNTRGVMVEERAAPARKNEKLKKKGRPYFPGFVRVLSGDYVTAITTPYKRKGLSEAPSASSEAKRRSPIPHLRRGHWRHYATGEPRWINDMLIGTKHENELSWTERKRAGYKLKGT